MHPTPDRNGRRVGGTSAFRCEVVVSAVKSVGGSTGRFLCGGVERQSWLFDGYTVLQGNPPRPLIFLRIC